MHIVTVTVNPCIDKSATIPALVAEKKLRCTKPVLEPGGGGINVARAITKLGGDATALYLSGGYNGTLIASLLAKEGVDNVPIPIKEDTRENTIIFDTGANAQYRFCMPGPLVSEDEWQQCLQAVNKSNARFIVASGSLPPGIPAEFFALFARLGKANGARVVIDTSGEALKAALDEGVYMVKPNLAELSDYYGVQQLTADDARLACAEIINAGKCSIIMLSMGGAGALVVTKDFYHHIVPPPVVQKSTVGAGDSMTGGMVLKLSQGADVLSAAQYGTACGTAATIRPGTQLCDAKDAEALYNKIKAS